MPRDEPHTPLFPAEALTPPSSSLLSRHIFLSFRYLGFIAFFAREMMIYFMNADCRANTAFPIGGARRDIMRVDTPAKCLIARDASFCFIYIAAMPIWELISGVR